MEIYSDMEAKVALSWVRTNNPVVRSAMQAIKAYILSCQNWFPTNLILDNKLNALTLFLSFNQACDCSTTLYLRLIVQSGTIKVRSKRIEVPWKPQSKFSFTIFWLYSSCRILCLSFWSRNLFRSAVSESFCPARPEAEFHRSSY